MRLRQVVLVARNLREVEEQLTGVFGWKVTYRDPIVAKWGLENIVIPIGNDFLEVVSPVRDGTAAGRQLDRMGGDGGYMVLFQVADRAAQTRRLAAMGVRVAYTSDQDTYCLTHFHPADCGGVMLSLDQVTAAGAGDWTVPDGYWHAAQGLDWRRDVVMDRVGEIRRVVLSGSSAADLADLYGRLLDQPAEQAGDDYRIVLPPGPDLVLTGGGKPGAIARIELAARDADAVRKEAAQRGLLHGEDILIAGAAFTLV